MGNNQLDYSFWSCGFYSLAGGYESLAEFSSLEHHVQACEVQYPVQAQKCVKLKFCCICSVSIMSFQAK
jgi:hypothetical protein